MGSNKSFAEAVGGLVGKIILTCIAILIASTVIAVSVKLIQYIIMWLF